MAKQEKIENLIPDSQSGQSLNALADYFERVVAQLRFAANQVGDKNIEVVSTPTFRRGIGYAQSWLGNLFQSVSSMPFENMTSDDDREELRAIAQRAAQIERDHKAKLKKEAEENSLPDK